MFSFIVCRWWNILSKNWEAHSKLHGKKKSWDLKSRLQRSKEMLFLIVVAVYGRKESPWLEILKNKFAYPQELSKKVLFLWSPLLPGLYALLLVSHSYAFFFFGHTVCHVRSLFPSQGSNSWPLAMEAWGFNAELPGKYHYTLFS